jgi:hypothetical protein
MFRSLSDEGVVQWKSSSPPFSAVWIVLSPVTATTSRIAPCARDNTPQGVRHAAWQSGVNRLSARTTPVGRTLHPVLMRRFADGLGHRRARGLRRREAA